MTAMVITDTTQLQLEPGQSKRAWLGVGTSWFGSVRVPLFVARGPSDGPKFVVIAAQHGDEGYGVLALLDLMAEIDATNLRGELWLLPCVNPFGYIAGKRVSPYDGQDMNRVHPGQKEGTLTQQIARFLYEQVFPEADLLLDLHGGSPENGDIAFGRWTDAPDKPSPLSILRTLDLRFLIAPGGKDIPGMLSTVTPDLGIPAISIEAGSCVRYARDNANEMAGFIRKCMHCLGMVDGAHPQPKDLPFMRTVTHWCHTGGAYKALVSLGETVTKGQRLSYVMDLLGNVVQEVEAPEDAVVAVMRTGVRVHPGESLLTMAVPTEYTP